MNHSAEDLQLYARDSDSFNKVLDNLNAIRKDAEVSGNLAAAEAIVEHIKQFKALVDDERQKLVETDYEREKAALLSAQQAERALLEKEWETREAKLVVECRRAQEDLKMRTAVQMNELHQKLEAAILDIKPNRIMRDMERKIQSLIWIKKYSEAEELKGLLQVEVEKERALHAENKRLQYKPREDRLKQQIAIELEQLTLKLQRITRDFNRAKHEDFTAFENKWSKNIALLKDSRKRRVKEYRTVPERMRTLSVPLSSYPSQPTTPRSSLGSSLTAPLSQSPSRQRTKSDGREFHARRLVASRAGGPVGAHADLISSLHPATRTRPPSANPATSRYLEKPRPKSAPPARGEVTPSRRQLPTPTANENQNPASDIRNRRPAFQNRVSVVVSKSKIGSKSDNLFSRTPAGRQGSPGRAFASSPRTVLSPKSLESHTYQDVNVSLNPTMGAVYSGRGERGLGVISPKKGKNPGTLQPSNRILHSSPPPTLRSPGLTLADLNSTQARSSKVSSTANARKTGNHPSVITDQARHHAPVSNPSAIPGPNDQVGLTDDEMQSIVNRQLSFIGACKLLPHTLLSVF